MIHKLGAVLDWLMIRVANLPSTNTRIMVTLALVVATGVVYLVSRATWEPSTNWLAFLAIMSGLDATQYFAKRATDAGYAAAKRASGATPAPGNGP